MIQQGTYGLSRGEEQMGRTTQGLSLAGIVTEANKVKLDKNGNVDKLKDRI
jgi:hypothetical protein